MRLSPTKKSQVLRAFKPFRDIIKNDKATYSFECVAFSFPRK